ncbi:21173_t:CDS:2, partial [Gigaspora rosea]
ESENFVGSAIRTCEPISKKYGLFYFEVTIKDKGKTGIIGIGFCTKTVKLDRMPAMNDDDPWATIEADNQ